MAIQIFDHAAPVRREIATQLTRKVKSELGQFMTPATVARFMASLFPASTKQACRLLDAGAGLGALSTAFLDRCGSADGLDFQSVEIEAYEIDKNLRPHLETSLASYTEKMPLKCQISGGDFIWEAACQSLRGPGRFTHAILNPPYKKINSASGASVDFA
jgi:adenine-specific DNA-methyltransferase